MGRLVWISTASAALALSACGQYGPHAAHGDGTAPAQGVGAGAMGTRGQLGMIGLMAGLDGLGLSAEQRARIDQIRSEARQRGLEILQASQAPREAAAAPETAADAQRAYDAMAAAHRQVFELHLQAREGIVEVLTPAQRERLGAPRHGR